MFLDYSHFQSTLLQEERLPTESIVFIVHTFNPRSYKRSDTVSPPLYCVFSVFQSTLLQEERRHIQFLSFNVSRLSIHAPTRGATFTVKIMLYIFSTFNPRSYKRSDDYLLHLHQSIELSIHAPTRGATGSFANGILASSTFNPRSYKRSDLSNVSADVLSTTFNPRSYKRSDNILK